jgi:glycosyltransferase involved in cell wall biosynthesis
MSVRLQIYILCRNRPAYANQAISSLLVQATSSVQLIVSDNSSNNETERLVAQFYPCINYIRRYPPLDAESHFRSVIAEATADALVMFHDDDRALPGFVQAVLQAVDLFPNFSAIGFNGIYINTHGRVLRKAQPILSLPPACKYITINPVFLAQSYFSPKSAGHPPFPSYVYNCKMLSTWMMSSDYGGKHADLCLLAILAKKTPLIWSSEVVMEYRRHHGNDSTLENIYHRLRTKRFLFRNKFLRKNTVCERSFTVQYWLFWWIQNQGLLGIFRSLTSWRLRVILLYLVGNPALYLLITNRMKRLLHILTLRL